ncbi:MAG: hypothetical protein ACWA5K_07760 [bacterium]
MRLFRFLFSVALLACGLQVAPALAEPALPGGIGDDSGLVEDASWPAEDDWGFAEDDFDESNNFPVTGFVELRLGHRLSSVDNQRDATLSELRLELEKDVAWETGAAKVTADFIYDDIEDSRHIDLETGRGWIDLREAWVSEQLGSHLDVKIGRQILTWGVGDLTFINDLFPKDWNSFLAGRDEQYLKAPSDALRFGWYSEFLNANLVYTPRFDADRYIDGRRLSYFSPAVGEVVGRNGVLRVEPPDQTAEDDEIALRIYRNIGSFEVALYGYDGFWKSPGGFNPATGSAEFPRLRVLGASARGPLGSGILSLEMGRYSSRDDRSGDNPLINNSEFRALAAYEWEVFKETTLNLQYYVEMLSDYDAYKGSLLPEQKQRDKYRHLVTSRLTWLTLNQNLTTSLVLFYSPSDKDVYLRPRVSYKVTDDWLIEGGANIFSGADEHTFFGQLEDNNNLYIAFRYHF